MAGRAVGLAGKDLQAPFLLRAQCVVIAPHVAVERRVGLHEGAFESRNRHVGVTDVGPVVAEHVPEPLPILGHEGESRLHHVVLAVAAAAAARGRSRLLLQRLRRTGPEQLSVVGGIDDRLTVSPVNGAGVADAHRGRDGPADMGMVARGARHSGIAGEDRIEEQHLSELDLLRRHRVVRRNRGRAEGREAGRPRSVRPGRRGGDDEARGDGENRPDTVHGCLAQFRTSRQLRIGA